MIIEAGYDILQVLYGGIYSDRTRASGLWVVGMDENLRLLFTTKVSSQNDCTIAEHVDEILNAFTNGPSTVRYYAVAYSVDRLPENDRHCPHHDEDSDLEAPALAPYELLGRVVFDGASMCSTVPRYSFRDYPDLGHLPRSGVVLGPHDVVCDCFACAQHSELLERNRARHQRLAGTPSTDDNDGDN